MWGLAAAAMPFLLFLCWRFTCRIFRVSQQLKPLLFLSVYLILHFGCGGAEGSRINRSAVGSSLDALKDVTSFSSYGGGTACAAFVGILHPLSSLFSLSSDRNPKASSPIANRRLAEVSRHTPLGPPACSRKVCAASSTPLASQEDEEDTLKTAATQEEGEDVLEKDLAAASDILKVSMKTEKTEDSASLHSAGASGDWHSKRKRQQMRRAEYLRRGHQRGVRTPPVALNPAEKEALDARQTALEKSLDRMLAEVDVHLEIHQLENCRLQIDATVSGEFTRQLWELGLTSLRSSFRQSTHASPLDISQGFLLQKAGGISAFRKDVLRFMAEAIKRKACLQHNARILGNVEFEEDVNSLADRLSPGSPLALRLFAERYPKIHFKRPYKGLKLRVPKSPANGNNIVELTENYLLYKHAKLVDYPEPQPSAKEGDTVLLQVESGWFEERDGSMGLEIPAEFIKGPTTLHLVKPWLPTELLENVKGLAVGKKRLIKVHIPFHASQLLRIYKLQTGKLLETSEKPQNINKDFIYNNDNDDDDDDDGNEEKGRKQEGRSLASVYLESIAEKTKENFLTSLFGQETKISDKPNDLTKENLQTNGKKQTGETEERTTEAEEEETEIHNIDCLLQVECLGVKRRVPPKADDAFFMETCGMPRAQLRKELEKAGEALRIQRASKYAMGAAAAALDEITQAEIPESLIEGQAKITWKQQLKTREFQGEDNSKINTKEGFLKWKEENRKGIENILKTSFAIQAVCRSEGLEVNEKDLQRELGKTMLQAPADSMEILTKQLYKKAQARLVYNFIVENAEIEFYVEQTPAQVTVETEGENKIQQGVKAFPKGANIPLWHKMRNQTERDRDDLRSKAERLFVDAKELRKFDKKDI